MQNWWFQKVQELENICALSILLFSFLRDHLCNLYGPTIIAKEKNANVVLRYIPESEEDSFAGEVFTAAVNSATSRSS